LNN
jgi:ubiquitin-activating enzyme E1